MLSLSSLHTFLLSTLLKFFGMLSATITFIYVRCSSADPCSYLHRIFLVACVVIGVVFLLLIEYFRCDLLWILVPLYLCEF